MYLKVSIALPNMMAVNSRFTVFSRYTVMSLFTAKVLSHKCPHISQIKDANVHSHPTSVGAF